MKKRLKKLFLGAAAILLVAIIVQACKAYYFRSDYTDVNKLLHETNNLKTKVKRGF